MTFSTDEDKRPNVMTLRKQNPSKRTALLASGAYNQYFECISHVYAF